MLRSVSAVVIVALATGAAAMGQDLPPAQTLLDRMQVKAPAQQPVAQKQEDFVARAEKFGKAWPQLAEDEAARQWLELFDDEAKGTNHARAHEMIAHDADPWLAAMPGPKTWPAIVRLVDARPEKPQSDPAARRERALKILAHLLVGDRQWLSENLQTLKSEEERITLGKAVLGDARSNDQIVQDFASTIAQKGEPISVELEVPDLVTLAGKEKATTILSDAVTGPYMLNVKIGDQTRKLAQTLTLEKIEQVRTPQWILMTSDSLSLYEALLKKFPAKKIGDDNEGGFISGLLGGRRSRPHDEYKLSHARERATRQYFYGLVLAGRADDAVKLLQSQENESPLSVSVYEFEELNKVGRPQAVYDTIHKILKDNPDVPLWDLFRTLAARTGHLDELVALARQSAARQGLTPQQRIEIQKTLFNALLAADQVDEAVALMQTCLEDPMLSHDDRISAATKLVRLGQVLKRPELIDRGVAAANLPTGQESTSAYYYQSLVEELDLAGRGTDAMEIVAKQLQRVANRPEKDQGPMTHEIRPLLSSAVKLYRRHNRGADVLRLLDAAPGWGVADLSGLMRDRYFGEKAVVLAAAEALHQADRNDEALKVVNALLDREGGMDDAYALMVKLDPQGAIARLDQLAARDAFEERPLIWKAHLLRQAGKLDEAEKVAREAITIDPSDGEQGKKDRMRVYAVLADILADKKDDKQAAIYRGAVTAIRTAEDADDLHEAGLLKRAVEQYKQALTHFADAYCIQSRLAVQLMEMGWTIEAEKHYQRAYELMPDSFGRVESHCFGCEKAFAGEQQQSIAERVFSGLAKKNPNKAQVHYLLGYLREEQDRTTEALESFQTAVKLDGKYLNAWKHIAGLDERMHISQDERDRTRLMLLRLDPLGRHTNPDLDDVRAMKALWEAVEETAKLRLAPTPNLLSLSASAAMMDKGHNQHHFVFSEDASQKITTPAMAVGKTKAVQALRKLMQGSVKGASIGNGRTKGGWHEHLASGVIARQWKSPSK